LNEEGGSSSIKGATATVQNAVKEIAVAFPMTMTSEAVIRGSFATINIMLSRLETDLRACRALVLKIPPMSGETKLGPYHDEAGTMFLQTISIVCEAERWLFTSLQVTSSSTETDVRIELGVFPKLDKLDGLWQVCTSRAYAHLICHCSLAGQETHVGWQGVCASLTKLHAVLPELDHLGLAIGSDCSEHASCGARITKSASDLSQESFNDRIMSI
jgi:hypothetical protein